MEHPDNFISWVKAAADPETFGSPFNPTSISGMPLFVDIREEDFYELSKVAVLADKYLEEERKKGVEVYLPFWPRPEFTQLMVGTVMKAVKRLMKHGPKSYSVEQLYQRDLAIFAMVLAMKNKVDLGTPLSDEVFTQLWLTGLGIGDNANAFQGFLIEAFLRQDIDLVNPHGATVITGNCIQKFAILYHAHLLKEILDNIQEPADEVPPKVYYSHRICTREEMRNLCSMERYSLARAASQEDKRDVKSLLQTVKQRWHELEEHTGKIADNWIDRVRAQWIHWNNVSPRIPEASLQEEIVRCCGPPQPAFRKYPRVPKKEHDWIAPELVDSKIEKLAARNIHIRPVYEYNKATDVYALGVLTHQVCGDFFTDMTMPEGNAYNKKYYALGAPKDTDPAGRNEILLKDLIQSATHHHAHMRTSAAQCFELMSDTMKINPMTCSLPTETPSQQRRERTNVYEDYLNAERVNMAFGLAYQTMRQLGHLQLE
ncbi:hypothetical protein R1sor_011930 [Riccia sorocarpa]|uniref:Uncharacterized protein n=1 Tax=Riccia sorocarpa TaxID=122646 RepID=A0ABD3I482_9MARC